MTRRKFASTAVSQACLNYNEGEQNERTNGDGDEEYDIENAMPLAAIEAALTPTVLATFDKIADSSQP
jgi:hypothetical protein